MDARNEIELANLNEMQQVELEDAIAKRQAFEENIKNIWGYTPMGLEAKKAAMSMLSTKTGLYAKVPINCKADSCPYATTCVLLDAGLAPRGQKCPMETAMIETRYAGYQSDYGLDTASYTDNTIISELINLDVTMERCKALLAAQQMPIEEVVAGIGENGQEFTRPEISKAWEIYERASNRREKILESMLGTRRSRKGEIKEDKTFDDILSEVYNQDFVIEEKPDEF